MRASFPLFQSHLDLTKSYWQRLLKPADHVIDATCGNGKDTLFLASLVLPQGVIHAIDTQEIALKNTKDLLIQQYPDLSNVFLHLQSHAVFPNEIKKNSIKGIVYNLGYLPGGDKTITTKKEETLQSVEAGLSLLCPNGFMSITCYSGHPQGKEEEEGLVQFCSTLDPKKWNVTHHLFINRELAPSLIFIQSSSH